MGMDRDHGLAAGTTAQPPDQPLPETAALNQNPPEQTAQKSQSNFTRMSTAASLLPFGLMGLEDFSDKFILWFCTLKFYICFVSKEAFGSRALSAPLLVSSTFSRLLRGLSTSPQIN